MLTEFSMFCENKSTCFNAIHIKFKQSILRKAKLQVLNEESTYTVPSVFNPTFIKCYLNEV